MHTLRKTLAHWLFALACLISPSRTILVTVRAKTAAGIEEVALAKAKACFGEDGKYTIVPGYIVRPDVFMNQFTGDYAATVTVREG
ncbi:hypothetical protein [Actinomadura sp. NPDC049753]|uniref:hypothetical protein n=1 Tax=Actinomadura sp. NPDC049753 TaxID=3154739 RepID=UPI00341D534C